MISPDRVNMHTPDSGRISASSQMQMHLRTQTSPSSSSRILDIPCKVCGDNSSGKHYNIFACDGCAGFFKRSIRKHRHYVCKAKEEGSCIIDKAHRNQCRACRLHKCEQAGMNKDAVQHERGPRNSTLRRQQLSNFLSGESTIMIPSPGAPINLSMRKYEGTPPLPLPQPGFFYNNVIPTPWIHPVLLPPNTPPSLPAYNNPSEIYYESVAKLLFSLTEYVKNIPSFTTLPLQDQLHLLKDNWLDLFILEVSQTLPFMDLRQYVQSCDLLQEEPHRAESFLKEIQNFQATLKAINEFRLDQLEFAYLRAIVLFKSSGEKPSTSSSSPSSTTQDSENSLIQSERIASIQESAQVTLNTYLRLTHAEEPLRFGKLLVLVNSRFASVSSSAIEELFFKKFIRNAPLSAVITNMYRPNSSVFPPSPSVSRQ